jgi:hypothetical protein
MTYDAWKVMAELTVDWIREAEAVGDEAEAARLRNCIWYYYDTITD